MELGLKEIFKQGVKYREPEKSEEGVREVNSQPEPISFMILLSFAAFVDTFYTYSFL